MVTIVFQTPKNSDHNRSILWPEYGQPIRLSLLQGLRLEMWSFLLLTIGVEDCDG